MVAIWLSTAYTLDLFIFIWSLYVIAHVVKALSLVCDMAGPFAVQVRRPRARSRPAACVGAQLGSARATPACRADGSR
jgi:hypothetical protein